MQAFVYEGGKNFSLKDVPVPEAKAGEIVAKVLCASICGTDLRTFRNGSDKLHIPITMGHEACVLVTSVGHGVEPAMLGKRHIIVTAIGCGRCRSCMRGHTNMCDNLETIGFQYDGTFAEYILIPQIAVGRGHLIATPDAVTNEMASVVEPIACVINAHSYLKIEEGDNVLIYCACFLGCMHAEIAKINGAKKIVIAEISSNRRRKAEELLPYADLVDSSSHEYREKIQSIVGVDGVDVVITACPAGITHKEGLQLISKNGRMSLFGGLPAGNSLYLDSNLIHYKEVSVFGAHASTVEQNRMALDMISSKKLDVQKYITSFSLEDIELAFQGLVNETVEKAVIIP